MHQRFVVLSRLCPLSDKVEVDFNGSGKVWVLRMSAPYIRPAGCHVLDGCSVKVVQTEVGG